VIRLPFAENGDVLEAIEAGRATVEQGGVLLLPTESFYGLGADPWSKTAVERIFSMKVRPAELGLPVLCADWQQVEALVEVPDAFRIKLTRLWPAALTVVLPTVGDIPAARSGTLAVRIPDHHELRALLYRLGPLTGTSANRHGEPPSTTVDGAVATLADTRRRSDCRRQNQHPGRSQPRRTRNSAAWGGCLGGALSGQLLMVFKG
jgi:tRNA threonylcarbamoyl adenosine modification protein (Sua5/YciO/YrdC/YwlC family)